MRGDALRKTYEHILKAAWRSDELSCYSLERAVLQGTSQIVVYATSAPFRESPTARRTL